MDTLLGDTPDQMLAAVAVLAVLVAVRLQLSLYRLRQDLAALDHERADPRTGLLPQTAIPVRLGSELQWAQHAGRSLGVLVFHIHGGNPERAGRALRRGMRGDENGYVLAPGKFAVGLWDADEVGCAIAVRRLSGTIARAGFDVVDAGLALYPDDGDDVDELLEIAQQQLRPVDQQHRPGRLRARTARGTAGRFARVLAGAGMGLALAIALVAAVHLGFEWLLRHRGDMPGGDLEVGAVAAGLALAPFAFAAAWWRAGAGDLPRSCDQGTRSARIVTGVAAALVAALAAVTTIDPGVFANQRYLGLAVAFTALLMVVPVQARYLVRADPLPMLVALAAAGGALALVYDVDPVTGNVARLVVAVLLGNLLARAMERAWWVLVVSAAIAVVDVWSVFADSGPTRRLVDGDASALQVLLLQGPRLHGEPLLWLGTTDVVFFSVFLSFVHFWRLPVARTAVALLAGSTAAFVVAGTTEDAVPVLPFLAGAFVVANAGRLWRELRDAIRPSRPDHDDAAPGSGAAPV